MTNKENVVPAESPQAGGDPYSNVEALEHYLKQAARQRDGITAAEVARRIDYSASALSQYRKRKYAGGNVVKLNEAVGTYLTAERAYAQRIPHVSEVAMTSQVKECLTVITLIREHRDLGVIISEAGLGKTRALEEYARRHLDECIFLTANDLARSPSAFVSVLWRAMPGMSRGGKKSVRPSYLLMEEIISSLQNKNKFLIIDEANKLQNRTLETIRSIQDKTKIGVVLSGNFLLNDDLGFQHPSQHNAQLLSRIRVRRVLSPEITRHDLALVAGLYGVDDPQMLSWLHKRCNKPGRRFRWVDTILTHAHSYSKTSGRAFDIKALAFAEQLTNLY